jgi:hypothetical protein
MSSQRCRQLKLTSVAVVVAVLDERRLQVSQQAQARREDNQCFSRSTDEAEIILTSSLSCLRIAVVIIIIKNIRNLALVSTFAFVLDFVLVLVLVLARDCARNRVFVFALVSTSAFASLSACVSV